MTRIYSFSSRHHSQYPAKLRRLISMKMTNIKIINMSINMVRNAIMIMAIVIIRRKKSIKILMDTVIVTDMTGMIMKI